MHIHFVLKNVSPTVMVFVSNLKKKTKKHLATFTRPSGHATCKWEPASEILHPCLFMHYSMITNKIAKYMKKKTCKIVFFLAGKSRGGFYLGGYSRPAYSTLMKL